MNSQFKWVTKNTELAETLVLPAHTVNWDHRCHMLSWWSTSINNISTMNTHPPSISIQHLKPLASSTFLGFSIFYESSRPLWSHPPDSRSVGSHRLRGEGSDGTTSCKELQEILFTILMNHHVESCNCRTSVENSFPQYRTVESSSCPPSLTFKFASLRFWNSPTYELLRWIYGCSFVHSGKRPRRRVAAEATRSSRWNRVLHLSVDHWNFQPFNALKTIIPNNKMARVLMDWPTLLETNFKLWYIQWILRWYFYCWTLEYVAACPSQIGEFKGRTGQGNLGNTIPDLTAQVQKETSLEKEWLESWTRINSESLRENLVQRPTKCIFQPV